MTTAIKLKTLFDANASEIEPLTDPQIIMSMQLAALEDREGGKAVGTIAELIENMNLKFEGFSAINLMLKRLGVFAPDMVFSGPVILMLASLCERPAHSSLWTYSLIQQTKKRGRTVTMLDLALILPEGFPSQDFVHKLWDDQKTVEGENYIDSPEVNHA